MVLVMRVYFEKPRTTLGWKGLINDPWLDGSCDMSEGLRKARALVGVFKEARSVLLPGPVVPSDGSRDAGVAVDVGFHSEELPTVPSATRQHRQLEVIAQSKHLQLARAANWEFVRRPTAKGVVHAWIGIVLGACSVLATVTLLVLVILANL